ncbi:MAG: mechanosensitive ion channel family protein [candidate division Zixibacteria bacterium]|nr:mechanosensitive ion channel family protein [candidate division Zixibacteria bacterium]
MEILKEFVTRLQSFIPTAIAIIGVAAVLIASRWFVAHRYSALPGMKFRRQMTTLILSFFGLLVIILALPVSESTTGQLLSLFGLLLSAAIALSATTFVGNIMAGLMLRAVKNFRAGDFVRIGDHFGRVSERGLFHVEVQTEDRDLVTLPNLYLVTTTSGKPCSRRRGTLLSRIRSFR